MNTQIKEQITANGKKFLTNVKSNWQIVLIVLFATLSLIFWQRNYIHNKEIVNLKSQVNMTKKIEETDAQLDAMKKRQQELYPELEKKQLELKNIDQELSKKRALLNEIKREKFTNEYQKMDINQLNNLFHQSGYSTSICDGTTECSK